MASDMQRQRNDNGTRHQAHARRARRAAQATRLGPAARSGSPHDPRPAAHDRRGAVRASLRRRSPLPWSATRQRGATRHASRRLPPSRRVGLVAPPLRRRGRSAMVWHIAVVVAILASGYDLFLRVRAQRRQRVPGGTDELTQLENRRAFYELAGREAAIGAADRLLHGAKAAGRDTFWSEVIMPQPIEGFEPTRLRRAYRVPPGFDLPMPPPLDRPR